MSSVGFVTVTGCYRVSRPGAREIVWEGRLRSYDNSVGFPTGGERDEPGAREFRGSFASLTGVFALFMEKKGSAVVKLGVAVRERFENTGKFGIAVEARISAVGR
jgi:hypothetical protein